MVQQFDRGMAILALNGYASALHNMAAYKARQSHPDTVSIWDAQYISTSMLDDAYYDDLTHQITGDAYMHYHYLCGATKYAERVCAIANYKFTICVDDDLRIADARFELM